ncbi:nicotinate phosphoribosyltransferase [Canibacter zhoujuaniae]|uniref:nicotinate phosphoribosyltransferase n=1 Tax=Canibacter zhoujuaniae TaxID=2708343 RepID=UPI001420030F|nr:nicotinate phosphoribosyltransferase [Canibacter zhoujuaniae]
MSKSTAFHTDHYELTMVDAALRSGTAHRKSVFELFTRRLSGARKYGVLAGTGRLLAAIENFRYTDAELNWLRDRNFLHSETLDWLANYRFNGNITGYAEGEVFFPGSPLLTVESTFAEGVVLETLALSILNYDSAVATAASRMHTAAKGKPLAEMGSRRTSEINAVYAARAAYLAGFSATSNLEAGRTYGLPTMGTAAHSFTLLHDSEEEAFRAQIAAFGPQTTLLIDTYDIEQGVKNAIEIAGPELGAVRIDSGDLPVVVARVRELLDSLGAKNTKITVTNDLDEHTIAALAASPVDNFGVGTSVVTGSGSPTMNMVYKLVARQGDDGQWVSVAKKSENKGSVGGKKIAYREFKNGRAIAELFEVQAQDGTDTAGVPGRENLEQITVPLITDGNIHQEHLGAAGLEAARERHAQRLQELPLIAMSLQRGDPALQIEYIGN